MKKIICSILVLAMIFAFAGCAGQQKETLKVAVSPDFAPMEFIGSRNGTFLCGMQQLQKRNT